MTQKGQSKLLMMGNKTLAGETILEEELPTESEEDLLENSQDSHQNRDSGENQERTLMQTVYEACDQNCDLREKIGAGLTLTSDSATYTIRSDSPLYG